MRKEAKAALEKLKAQGKKIDSGNRDTLVRTEELVNCPLIRSIQTKPDGKFELVGAAESRYTNTMVEDRLDDSAALTLSDIGVVMNESECF